MGSVYRDFTSGAGDLILNVWADDSAGVYLDGIEIIAPLTTTGAICSGGVVGCRPPDAGTYHQAIAAGNHTLRFDLYQTGRGLDTATNPTGMLFSGTAPGATDPPVPEPASLLLMGSGLAGVWIARRRPNRAA